MAIKLFGFTLGKKEQAKELAEIMCDAIELKVPMKTDIETGSSWGASM